MQADRLHRTRAELGDFLRRRREDVSPASVGLPASRRRRTPGLRREEVAALAGVGVTWYTWLEQGRAITVSAHLLDNVARVLRLDPTERRHLYFLAQGRPPVEDSPGDRAVPPLVRRLLNDLPLRPACLLDLYWTVLGWNAAAARLFGFGEGERAPNMLRLFFADEALASRIDHWDAQAPQIVASFRRDFARAPNDATMQALVDDLERRSSIFRDLWRRHDVQGRCEGRRRIAIDGVGAVTFEHSTFLLDEERHLRLILYAASADDPASARFEATLDHTVLEPWISSAGMP